MCMHNVIHYIVIHITRQLPYAMHDMLVQRMANLSDHFSDKEATEARQGSERRLLTQDNINYPQSFSLSRDGW